LGAIAKPKIKVYLGRVTRIRFDEFGNFGLWGVTHDCS
jgi:hypothetical protein